MVSRAQGVIKAKQRGSAGKSTEVSRAMYREAAGHTIRGHTGTV